MNDESYYSRKRAGDEYDRYLGWQDAWQNMRTSDGPFVQFPVWLAGVIFAASIGVVLTCGLFWWPLLIVGALMLYFSA